MITKKITEKQRGYLRLAYEVQQIAKPYLDRGGHYLIEIYLNHVVKKVPVSINTFRKMMKEDLTEYPQIVKDYHEKAQNQYFNLLQNQSRRRIKGTQPNGKDSDKRKGKNKATK